MNFLEFAEQHIIVFDGAFGTALIGAGKIETVHITAPETVRRLHRDYFEAGAHVATANTFGANAGKLGEIKVREAVASAVNAARAEAEKYNGYVVLDIGPLGGLMSPLGSLTFADAYRQFKEIVEAGADADAILIETMTDLAEMRCALLAAKENSTLPVLCTMTFEENMHTFLGTGIPSAAVTLTALGADFVGVNCSLGAAKMARMAQEMLKWTHLPVLIQPNAGLPSDSGYATPQAFVGDMERIISLGASAVGGCCGTTPAHIKLLRGLADGRKPEKRDVLAQNILCTPNKLIKLEDAVVGSAIPLHDADDAAEVAGSQLESDVNVIKINVDNLMDGELVRELQGYINAPLVFEGGGLETALRAYSGRAGVCGACSESTIKKYGALKI